MNNKYRLIYIAGGGHSGSTLLDMILGTSPEVFGTGEAYFYNSYNDKTKDPKLYEVHKRVCSCGREFGECPFWNSVKETADKKMSVDRRFSFLDTIKTIWNILIPWKSFQFDIRNLDDQHFMDSVHKTLNDPKIRYLLDSSKDPRRLLQLEQTFGEERIKLIFLVRDIRGYINSYTNPNKWRVRDAGLKPENFIRTGLRWIAVNLSIKAYIAVHNIDAIKIEYDQFAKDPDTVFQRIEKKWKLNIPDDYLSVMKKQTYHNIHGNLVKFSNIEKIKWDKSWEQQLPKWKKTAIQILFGWANYWFVYSDIKSDKS